MATIKIEAKQGEDKEPKSCGSHEPARRIGNFYEFGDASEEELAFWNTLDESEQREMSDQAYKTCFYDALHDYMKEEAEKGKKLRERQEKEIGGSGGVPNPPDSPPTAPPSGGGEPPIQSP